MGFLDRFRRNKDQEQQVKQIKQPLTLQYSDGITAYVHFDGLCEVEGKYLHQAHIEYVNPNGSFESRVVLLEPMTREQNGQNIDITEDYYRYMSKIDETRESVERYKATKGFFKKREITEEKLGSNYIGSVVQNQNRGFYRYYDEGFRNQHIQRTRIENARIHEDNIRRQQESEQEYQEYSRAMQENGKRIEDAFKRTLQDGRVNDEAFAEYCELTHVKYKDRLREELEQQGMEQGE